MHSQNTIGAAAAVVCLIIAASGQVRAELPPAAERQIDYARDIRPILLHNCHKCHGGEHAKGELQLDTREAVLKGGESGPVVVLGRSEASELVKRIASDDPDWVMPPKGARLAADQIALIRAWIDQGLAWSQPAADPAEHGASVPANPSSLTASSRPAQANSADPLLELLMLDTREQFIHRRQARLKQIPAPPAPPTVSGPVHNEIDSFIVAQWEKAGLSEAKSPPPTCDDAAFLRRAYLDVIGRVPTVDEADRFLKDAAPGKRDRLIDELLARDEAYADHWTPFWEEAIASNPFPITGGIPSRGDFAQFIHDSFKQNKPYDLMVAELLDPRMPGHRRSVLSNINGKDTQNGGFVLNQTPIYTIQTAADVGQVFLGTGMKCASCHNHFENAEWPQTRFLGFASLFAPQDLEQIRCEKKIGGPVAARFPFDLPGAPAAPAGDADGRLHYMTLLLTDPGNPRFSRTIVNRLWRRYLGLGLFEPVDDFRLDSPPSHPELLEWLAYDLMAHGYDLKRTIRLILGSRTYQLKYDPRLEDHFDLARRTAPRYYRSPSLRKLTAEQLIDSVRLITRQKLASAERLFRNVASTPLTRAMSRPPTRNEVCTLRSEEVAVVQSLELLNGEEYSELIYAARELINSARGMEPPAAVDLLYRAALSRPPTADERRVAAAFLTVPDTTDSVSGAPEPEEIVWVDDDLPAGSAANGSKARDSWKWAEAPVFSGKRSHTATAEANETTQHHVTWSPAVPVGPRDKLFSYVYLDPKNPPKEIMLQWNDGTWEHRAYWGHDIISFGQAGTPSRLYMGDLPKVGEWIRLEVRPASVGLAPGAAIVGVSFDQAGGTVHWDKTGVLRVPPDPMLDSMGDVLWALLTSPEFQYIR